MNIIAFMKRSLSFIFLVSAYSCIYADDHANTNAACPHPQSVVEKDSFSYFSSKQIGSSLVAASKHEKNMDIYRSLCGPSPKFLLNEQILQIMGKSYPNYFAVEPLLVKKENMPSKTSGPTAGQPTKQQPYNPICQNPESQVEMDSINYFNKKYPDSSADQNNMHKQNMETYKKLCSSPLKEKLGKSTIELINSSYPDYGVMLGVLDKEVNALKELQKYIQKTPSAPKEQKPQLNTPMIQAKPSKQVIINPACPFPVAQVEKDSKAHFQKEYPDSFSAQNMLHKANMKDFHQVCDNPLPEPLKGSAKKLFNQYYPSYSAIEMLLRAELKSFNELNNEPNN
jgi:hypothetical protein